MKSNFTLQQLAEGIHRQNNDDAARLAKKWGRYGILEGLDGQKRDFICRLLENQAAHLLKETNALSTGGAGLTSSGQITGFTSVAFPIVRRVFAGLIANELVSMQPLSLPSGLIFYFDYTYGNMQGGDAGVDLSASATNSTYTKGDSVYGNPVGKAIQGGADAIGGQYDLVGSGYSKVHKNSIAISGSNDGIGAWVGTTWVTASTVSASTDFTGFNARFVDYDGHIETDLADANLDYCFVHIPVTAITDKIGGADMNSLEQIALTGFGSTKAGAVEWGDKYQGGTGVLNLRKLNKRGNFDAATGRFESDPLNGDHIQFVVRLSNTGAAPTLGGAYLSASAAIADSFTANSDGSTLTIPGFETDFAVPGSPVIPELDIKIESTNVVSTTRKLKARWSPEAAQDVTAYFAIDLEVELTNLLSTAITMDIDREILNDLLTQANGANYFWSRAPGKIVNKKTGAEALQSSTLSPGPMAFTNIQDWYQTLLETITDVANTIGKKTLRGSANFIVVSPDVATILEHIQAYRPSYKIDTNGQVQNSMTLGVNTEQVGTLNGRYTVYKCMEFPANKILVGLKGSNFLECGYVYAPYVPLILTPVVHSFDDFRPSKGIMTRYGKKMIRSDFYGTVTVLDLNLI